MANPDLPGQFLTFLELAGRHTGADPRDGDGPLLQGQLGRFGQHGAIEPAGECHRHTAKAAKQCQELDRV